MHPILLAIGYVPSILIWGVFIVLCIVALVFLTRKGRKMRNSQSPKPVTPPKSKDPEDF